jgi:hypothetical protein
MKYPMDISETPGFVRFTPVDLSNELLKGAAQQIELYLPPAISFGDGCTYENYDAGAVGGAVMDMANKNKNASTASIASDFSKEGGAGDLAASIAAKMSTMVPGVSSELVQGSLRTADNPNTRVLFKSVNLRTFSFAFKMIPTSPEESLVIAAIVKEFRTQLYPETSGGSVGYKYPDMYKIELYHGPYGQELLVPPKVKPAFLQSVTTNLNSTSGAILAEAGSSQYWSEVDLTLEFFEGVTLEKNDVRNGY